MTTAEWVRVGLIWRAPGLEHDARQASFKENLEPRIAPSVARRIDRTPRRRCIDCGARTKRSGGRCRPCYVAEAKRGAVGTTHVGRPARSDADLPLWDTLRRNLEADRQWVICDDCGCLLAHVGETCPSCLVWAERDAVSASWRPDHYKPRQVALRKEAA